ncbi:MAG: tripartite tricarboxylate transporter substrate-binding protein, partial [Xanthobacteraceae bacterium]
MRVLGKATALATTLACALFGLVSSRAIGADDYPSRPVTIVVPYTPGASTDITGRYDAEVLQRALHGSFVVENRPGAGSSIGIGYVAKSAPDGYTLLNAPTSLVLLPYLMKSVSYEPVADLDPIVLVGLTEFTLVVSPSLN